MSINHAVLGILSYKPLTGYDLKKIMQDSSFMYWSGNNNQIYKALVELHDEGYVTNETHHQDGSPSKKIYTITDDGLAELKRWSLTMPETPEIKKAFLIQLAWAWQLSNAELNKLLDQYEQEITGQLLMERGKKGKRYFFPSRTPRESAIWELIYENVAGAFQEELNWINRVRQTIGQFGDMDCADTDEKTQNRESKNKEMNYKVVEKNAQKYILLEAEGKEIGKAQDSLELVGICAEHGTNLLLIQYERLPSDFFRLSTGVANAVLTKLLDFNIKTAAVIPDDRQKGKFKDFVSASNRGDMFNVYADIAAAENWLLKTNERMQRDEHSTCF